MLAEKRFPTIWEEYYEIYQKTDDRRQKDLIRSFVNVPLAETAPIPDTPWNSLYTLHRRFFDENSLIISGARELIFASGLYSPLYIRYPVTRVKLEKGSYQQKYYDSCSSTMRFLTGTLAISLNTTKSDLLDLHNDAKTQKLVDFCDYPGCQDRYWFSVRTRYSPWKLLLVFSDEVSCDPSLKQQRHSLIQTVFVGPIAISNHQ